MFHKRTIYWINIINIIEYIYPPIESKQYRFYIAYNWFKEIYLKYIEWTTIIYNQLQIDQKKRYIANKTKLTRDQIFIEITRNKGKIKKIKNKITYGKRLMILIKKN